MLLIYGNKYMENHEEWHKEKPSDEDMLTTTLDYLNAYEFLYEDNLPDDYYESVYWRIEE